MRILLFVYNFSAGYLFLMLSFTLTDSVKFQLLAFNNTYLNMVLLPSTSESCCVPFLGRHLLHFWEHVCHLNCWNMSLVSCWKFCRGFFFPLKPSESLALLSCSNLLICILLVLDPMCKEFSYWLRICINAD